MFMTETKFQDGRTWVLLKCAVCSKDVWRRVTHISNVTVCSNDCKSARLITKITLNCAQCNKLIERRPSQIARSKSGRVFCSKTCATSYNNQFKSGEAHGNWSGGQYRKNALEHYGARCFGTDCLIQSITTDIPAIMIDVHHIDGNRSNNSIDNLIPLCVWCHALETRNVQEKLRALV